MQSQGENLERTLYDDIFTQPDTEGLLYSNIFIMKNFYENHHICMVSVVVFILQSNSLYFLHVYVEITC
jgi:hypothetical protein